MRTAVELVIMALQLAFFIFYYYHYHIQYKMKNRALQVTILTLISFAALLYGADYFFDRYTLSFQLPVQSPVLIEDRIKSPLPKDERVIIIAPTSAPTTAPTRKPTATATPMPTATATPMPVASKYEKVIRKTLAEYGSPMPEVASAFAQQIERYPLYKEYPYLLPAMMIKETSAGKRITYANNCMNWGIFVPDFRPTSCEHVIERAASGIAERTPYYAKFRETRNLDDLLYVYAPPTSNDTEKYKADLMQLMAMFHENE